MKRLIVRYRISKLEKITLISVLAHIVLVKSVRTNAEVRIEHFDIVTEFLVIMIINYYLYKSINQFSRRSTLLDPDT